MSEGPDLDELARRYLDLWQDQVTALANDPDMAEAADCFLALMGMPDPGGQGPRPGDAGHGMYPWAAAWSMAMVAAMTALPPMRTGHAAHGTRAQSDAEEAPAARAAQGHADGQTTGAAAATGASGDGAVDMDALLRRLAVLEKRVESLESGSGGAEREPEAGPGGNQS